MTGERITTIMMQHLNEKVTIDMISRESGISLKDVQEFFDLREIMDDFKKDVLFYEENGTIYCILQDDRFIINHLEEANGPELATSPRISKAQAEKLEKSSAKMRLLDGIFTTTTAAVFAIVLILNVIWIFSSMWLYALAFNPKILDMLLSSLTNLIVAILAFCIMWRIDSRSSHLALKKGIKTNYGIDVVIAGIIGCFAWGIGALYIIKAAIIFAGEAYKDNSMKRGAIAPIIPILDGFNEAGWILPVFTGAAGLLTATSSLLRSTLLQGILNSTVFNQSLLMIGLSTLGIVAGLTYHKRVFPDIKRGEFKNLATIVLGLSIVGLACYGTSVPMLIESLLLFKMQDIITKVELVRKSQTNYGSRSLDNSVVPQPALEHTLRNLVFTGQSKNDFHGHIQSEAREPEDEQDMKLLYMRDEET